ncbi:MAG: hypothetical protein JJV98_07400 [Desulfosarcina sp.]|nr:hypothetical protein [Desulfobacterales bacterium]
MKTADPSPTPAALERRIKRHLIGPVQSFFAITAPGLETLCRRELIALPGALAVTGIEKGGLTFEGRLHECYEANLQCRTAHRILMRIEQFRAEQFETLVQKTAAIPWELYLPPGGATDVKVRARHSRLYHSDAVAERIQQGIQTRMAAFAPVATKKTIDSGHQRIYARLDRDRCQLSIDSSGANLHKRGIKIKSGRAPLRETLAAAVLLRAGYTGREILCDPMCGSGTFSLEGALMAKKIPPGWFREFPFMAWPAFRAARWRHIRRTAAPPDMAWPQPMIFASDRNPDIIRRLQQTLTAHGLDDVIHADHRNFEDLTGQSFGQTVSGIVVLNPPYGRRLGSRQSIEGIYRGIDRKLKSDFKGWTAAVLAPNRRLGRHLTFAARRHSIQHGGQPVHVFVGKIAP